MDLLFTLQKREGESGERLFVKVEEKGKRRLIYASDLQEMKKREGPLCSFLLKELFASSRGRSPETDASEIPIREENIEELLEELMRSKRLMWKGTSLFYNPLGKALLTLTAEEAGSEALLLTGSVLVAGKAYPLSSLDFFCQTKRGAVAVARSLLFFIPKEQLFPIFTGLYPEGKILEGKKRNRFIEDYLEDPPEGFPQVTLLGDFVKASDIIDPLPVLQLKDHYGAFASLFMDYQGRSIPFASPQDKKQRNLKVEKEWEKDLLETGFIRKESIDSSYHCPLDRVFSALSLLLDIGWTILDSSGKTLLKCEKHTLTVREEKKALCIEGSFTYGEHTLGVDEVKRALKQNRPFFTLSDASAALIEPEVYEEIKEVLLSSEAGGVLAKRHFGLLESLADKEEVSLDEETEALVKKQGEYTPQGEFKGELHPYQEEGKKWLVFLEQNGFSGLLADEMGLGKTVQTLAFLSHYTFPHPVLIVAPTSLIFNWQREWEKFIPHKKLSLYVGKERELPKEGGILTTYGHLRQDRELLAKEHFSLVILDEAQVIKNKESKVAKAAFSLTGDMKLCLTGTPVENRAEDLWSLFHFLSKELVGTAENFLISLTRKSFWKRVLSPYILRRKKEEVAKDLPEKVEQTVFVQMGKEQQRLYEEWLSKGQKGLLQKVSLEEGTSSRMEILELILRLRQICAHPQLVDSSIEEIGGKMEQVLSDLSEVVSTGRKVIIYSQFTKLLALVQKELKEKGLSFLYLDGSTKDREGVVEAFQTDPTMQIFLVSLKAGGVGLNLTAADYVFLLDPWWNEAAEKQAIDRVHRLGREGQVVARRYIAAMSIEEKILELKKRKALLAGELLDSAGEMPSFEELISLLTRQTEDHLAR